MKLTRPQKRILDRLSKGEILYQGDNIYEAFWESSNRQVNPKIIEELIKNKLIKIAPLNEEALLSFWYTKKFVINDL